MAESYARGNVLLPEITVESNIFSGESLFYRMKFRKYHYIRTKLIL